MSYDFSFDRKAAWALLAGSVVLGVLLFVAGVLVGGNMREKASAEQAEPGKAKDGASGEGETVAGPKVRRAPVAGEPVLMPAPLAPVEDSPFAAGPGVAAPGVPSPNTAAPGMAAPRLPPASSVAPPVESYGAEAQRAFPPPRDPDPKLVQEAESGAPGAEEEGPSAPPKGVAYSVQVGDYQEEKSARRLAEELERKGYTPSIFSGRDAENRVWFAVRVGVYAGAKDASQAAANITKQEKMKATVRPINSF